MTREEAIAHFETSLNVRRERGFVPNEYDDAVEALLDALSPVNREQVEKVWRGEWLHDPDTGYEQCENCRHTIYLDDYLNRKPPLFCEMCGTAMTDEAVQMVMERLEALKDIK